MWNASRPPPPMPSPRTPGAPTGPQAGARRRRWPRSRATAAAPRVLRVPPDGRNPAEAARLRGAVDVALASVMRDAMLRRSEAAALEWADVELRPDGSGRLTIRRSKTDQEGEGAVQYLGKGTAAALREIRPENPDARCSASAPDAPRPAASPLWQGQPGSKARSPDIRPRRDGPRSRGLRGLRRRRPELRAGGLPPGCLPTTFGASWPAAEPSPGSTGGS